MAKGWESKSVEDQQAQVQAPLTPEDKERISREKAAKMREVQALQLNRARIREQLERSTNERYNELLNRELAHIDEQLSAMD